MGILTKIFNKKNKRKLKYKSYPGHNFDNQTYSRLKIPKALLNPSANESQNSSLYDDSVVRTAQDVIGSRAAERRTSLHDEVGSEPSFTSADDANYSADSMKNKLVSLVSEQNQKYLEEIEAGKESLPAFSHPHLEHHRGDTLRTRLSVIQKLQGGGTLHPRSAANYQDVLRDVWPERAGLHQAPITPVSTTIESNSGSTASESRESQLRERNEGLENRRGSSAPNSDRAQNPQHANQAQKDKRSYRPHSYQGDPRAPQNTDPEAEYTTRRFHQQHSPESIEVRSMMDPVKTHRKTANNVREDVGNSQQKESPVAEGRGPHIQGAGDGRYLNPQDDGRRIFAPFNGDPYDGSTGRYDMGWPNHGALTLDARKHLQYDQRNSDSAGAPMPLIKCESGTGQRDGAAELSRPVGHVSAADMHNYGDMGQFKEQHHYVCGPEMMRGPVAQDSKLYHANHQLGYDQQQFATPLVYFTAPPAIHHQQLYTVCAAQPPCGPMHPAGIYYQGPRVALEPSSINAVDSASGPSSYTMAEQDTKRAEHDKKGKSGYCAKQYEATADLDKSSDASSKAHEKSKDDHSTDNESAQNQATSNGSEPRNATSNNEASDTTQSTETNATQKQMTPADLSTPQNILSSVGGYLNVPFVMGGIDQQQQFRHYSFQPQPQVPVCKSSESFNAAIMSPPHSVATHNQTQPFIVAAQKGPLMYAQSMPPQQQSPTSHLAASRASQQQQHIAASPYILSPNANGHPQRLYALNTGDARNIRPDMYPIFTFAHPNPPFSFGMRDANRQPTPF